MPALPTASFAQETVRAERNERIEQRSERTISTPDIPLPIVTFSRWVYALTLGVALVARQPLITTALLVVVVIGLVGGARWNIINRLGRALFARRIASDVAVVLEDYRVIRFNNLIVVGLLTAAQLAFVLNAGLVGWVLVAMIIAASSAALAGFCVGCLLYYQFKLHRYRFFGE
jgi:hypothetical protein